MARYESENITSINSVIGKFNAVLENKKLLILNELRSIGSSKYLNSNALKSVITNKFVNINQKNEAERLCKNVADFLKVSNNEISIRIETSNKRYVVSKTSDKHKDDFFTPEFYENLFTLFMTMNIKKDYNLSKLPNSEAKENIKEASMSSYELFVREYNDKIVKISGPELLEMYEYFEGKNRFQPCSWRTFIANVQQFTGTSKARWVSGKTQKVYDLLPEYLQRFKKYHEDLEKLITKEFS